MTPELKQYLTDWLDWVEAGAPDGRPFFRKYGLCPSAPYAIVRSALRAELRKDFGDDLFPFGTGFEYLQRADARTQHENLARIAWVREKLGRPA